jgi:hypothetical protein
MYRVWKMQSEHEEITFEQILQEGLWYENILCINFLKLIYF